MCVYTCVCVCTVCLQVCTCAHISHKLATSRDAVITTPSEVRQAGTVHPF